MKKKKVKPMAEDVKTHVESSEKAVEPSVQEVSEEKSEHSEEKKEQITDETQKKEELTPEQIIEEQKKKIEELNDKYLRLYAEFDNFRRRTLKERVELIQTASAEIILSLLPVLDDFDRAVSAMEQSDNVEALKEGINLISSKLKGILTQKGLEEMKSVGEVFNADFHDAVANVAVENEEQKGKVIDQIEKGYFLNGKILRHAKVIVGS